MLDPFWPDLARVSAIALLVLCIGGMLTVFILHAVATRLAPRTVGLLPWHVAAVSLAVLLRDVPLVWGISSSLGQAATSEFMVRVCIYNLAAVLLLVALAIVATTQRRRIQFARDTRRSLVVEAKD